MKILLNSLFSITRSKNNVEIENSIKIKVLVKL